MSRFSNLPKREIDLLGSVTDQNFNLPLYVYSIAINAASGRFKLNRLTKP
jgi:hypothetical protein